MNREQRVPARRFYVYTAGAVLDLRTDFGTQQGARGGGRRGRVAGFSSASRRRLFRAMAAISWDLLGPCMFVTLTYPGVFPASGRVVARHREALRSALERRWPGIQVAWKREYQRRGAPHFHLAVVAPPGVACICGARQRGSVCHCLDSFRLELSALWYRIVGSGDLRHLEAGTQVAWMRDHPAAYFAGYVGCSKGYQEAEPEGVDDGGRWWGFWNLSPEWRGAELSRRQWVELRRLLRAWNRANGRPARVVSRLTGEWHHARDMSASVLLFKLSRALSSGPVIC